MGQGIYLSMYGKASALLHSLTKNHCLVGGNKAAGVAGDSCLLLHQRGS